MAASYDRELIAQMLEGARRGDLHQFSVESIERAISQLRAADNADAAGVHTARRLPPDGIHTCSYQCDQPECIRAQRDDLAAQAERDAAEIVRLRGEVLDRPARVGGRDFKAGELVQRVVGRAHAEYDRHHGGCLRHPYTGELRDYRDVESDPDGTLCVGHGPLSATIESAEAKDPAPAMPNGVEGPNPPTPRDLAYAEAVKHGLIQEREGTFRAADNRDAAGVDSEEDAYVIERMGKMLAEIAVIVNGPEPDMTRWSYHDLPEKVRALKTAPAAATVGEAVAWRHPDEVPEVAPGGNAYFWVAVRRKHDGRVYSFPAQYLNAMLLCNERSDDTERSGNRYHHGPTCEDEGSFPATGWHVEKEHGEYDGVYQPLLDDADELVAWREVANYPDTAPPAPVQAAPQEGEALPSDGAYMIVYDDQDMHPETFARNGARDAAMRRFEQISGNWNAHLYAKIRSNCRDVDVPDALAAHHSACELGAVRELVEKLDAVMIEGTMGEGYDSKPCKHMVSSIASIIVMMRAALQHRGDSRGGEG